MANQNKLREAAKKSKQEKPTMSRTERRQQDIEAYLELLRQGKNQKEASEAVGHDKTWGSHVIAELKKKEPERLKGTPQEVKEAEEKAPEDTPQAPQKPQTAPKPIKTEESTPKEEKTEKKANIKPKSKRTVMGFKANADSMKNWKLYAEATGQEIGIMCSKAIDEYIKNHPLTEEQKQFLELKQKLNS